MIFSSQISLKTLAQLCHRLASSTQAGLDDRRIWRDEATRGNDLHRQRLLQISDELNQGNSLGSALATTEDYFPPLFRQLAIVGDTSGQHAITYQRLAEYYDHQLKTRRTFLSQLVYPMIQLGIALLVIGIFIWVMGLVPSHRGSESLDILGWGLVGSRGLIIYLLILATIGLGLLFVGISVRKGLLGGQSMRRVIEQIPGLGPALKTLALSRFTWALHLVLDTPLDLRRALPLAFQTAGNRDYLDCSGVVTKHIEQGQDMHTALTATGIFPSDLLDAVAVGEQSGKLVETMGRISQEYQQRATHAISLLAQITGYVVWGIVATFIVVMIFRIASFYLGTIHELTQPMG